MRWWPFSRRRRKLALLDADAQVAQAANDRRVAERELKTAKRERDEAKKVGAWARETKLADRFDLRLKAAYRTQIGRE